MNKDEYKISLSNCDFNKKRIRLSSPYSIKACELIGVDEEELLFVPKEEYLLKNTDCLNLPKELQDERYSHFNAKRLQLIKQAKTKRAELIKLNSKLRNRKNIEIDSNLNNNNYGLSTLYNRNENIKKSSSAIIMGNTAGNNGWGTSTAIKIGREKLRKMKERQELNIRLQIDYEREKNKIEPHKLDTKSTSYKSTNVNKSYNFTRREIKVENDKNKKPKDNQITMKSRLEKTYKSQSNTVKNKTLRNNSEGNIFTYQAQTIKIKPKILIKFLLLFANYTI